MEKQGDLTHGASSAIPLSSHHTPNAVPHQEGLHMHFDTLGLVHYLNSCPCSVLVTHMFVHMFLQDSRLKQDYSGSESGLSHLGRKFQSPWYPEYSLEGGSRWHIPMTLWTRSKVGTFWSSGPRTGFFLPKSNGALTQRANSPCYIHALAMKLLLIWATLLWML